MIQLLRQLSIQKRLIGAMGLISLVLVGLGAWAALAYKEVQSQADQMLKWQMDTQQDSSTVLASLERMARMEQAVLLTANNAVEAAEQKAAWAKQVKTASELLEAAKVADSSDAQRTTQVTDGLAAFKAYAAEVEPVLQKVVDAKIDANAGYAYISRAQPSLNQARTSLGARATATQDSITQLRAQQREQGQMQSNFRAGSALLLMVMAMWLMVNVARSVTRPLNDAAAQAQRMAEGDLNAVAADQGRDEVHDFMTALDHMRSSLRGVVGKVRDGSHSIHLASTEVASGNLDLSQRTEQTASNLQRTASAMEELTSTVQHSAESATQANQLAASAAEAAQRGGKVVAEVVSNMAEISGASRKIADITSVIDGIAFQTNILALNAAVEAARAGEQGRGFAVVAGEVRSLAQRSAEAAREIKSLIGGSVEKVETGARLVGVAGAAIDELVSSVNRVSDIIGEISSAAVEQSKGISEVNTSVAELDQMTQQNAALVEQGAAAAASMRSQTELLISAVSAFQLGDAPSGSGASAAAYNPQPPMPTLAAHEAAAKQVLAHAAKPAPAPARPASAPLASPAPKAAADDSDWETF
ncbi:methyl-accepting chemotaxis protein [Ideonella sp.]|jgi:methyl-accepting chemotaxis protein|uniref:methyl-accepting chemotaxis protein n=1 Tax=Ideonella sp. TaxID=1929293 RepID=UPI0037BE256D